MFLQTFWDGMQFTDNVLVNIALVVFFVICAITPLLMIVNALMWRFDPNDENKPKTMFEWIFNYWIVSTILVVFMLNRDFWRLVLTIIIIISTIIIAILRRIVQLGIHDGWINGLLFWLINFENSSNEVMTNERVIHKQQMESMNRSLAGARNVAATYRNAATQMVSLSDFTKSNMGGHYNLNWLNNEMHTVMNESIRKADATDKQIRNSQQPKNAPKKNDAAYATFSGGYVQGNEHNKGNNQKGQQPKQPKQPKQQQPKGGNWDNSYNVGYDPNAFNPNGQPPQNQQGNWGNQGGFSGQNYPQQPNFNGQFQQQPNQGGSKKQRGGNQQPQNGFGQFPQQAPNQSDPRGNHYRYQPDVWNQGNEWEQSGYPEQSEYDPYQPPYDGNGWYAEIPPQPEFIEPPKRRNGGQNRNPLNFSE